MFVAGAVKSKSAGFTVFNYITGSASVVGAVDVSSLVVLPELSGDVSVVAADSVVVSDVAGASVVVSVVGVVGSSVVVVGGSGVVAGAFVVVGGAVVVVGASVIVG